MHAPEKPGKLSFTFSKPSATEIGNRDAPGHPPGLKIGEEASAVSDVLKLPIASRPLDYMAVKFQLLDGRKYVATITEPFFITKDKKTGDVIGWGGGTLAKSLNWF